MTLPALFALANAVTAPVLAVSAPVRNVTVYSDRARVTRTAALEANGPMTVELPVQARDLDPRSIAVSATGAELQRVDVVWAPADQLPRTRVEELLDAIAKLDDQLAQLERERGAWQAQLSIASSLRPQLPAASEPRPQPRLNAAGWNTAFEFARARTLAAQAHLRTLTQHARPLALERQRLLTEARKVGASFREAGYRVVAHLNGHGPVTLAMTYVVGRARWRPIYDLQLDPATSQLDLQFAGEVSQESGEDWSDARLVLSTAEPATATRYPKVNTWKIGERERFIPTPIAEQSQPSPPPPADGLPAAATGEELLRNRLAIVLDEVSKREAWKEEPAPIKTVDQDGEVDGKRGHRDAHDALQQESAFFGRSASVQRPAPVAASPPQPDAPDEAKMLLSAKAPASPGASASPATESVGLVAPHGWSRPSYAADLPASLAGGYDLVYSALQPETVLSGKGTRRVALLSRRWPVVIERKVFPALGPDAFLVAQLKSGEAKPLPGGLGHLFVGADPAGTAHLPLIRPSEAVTLPLGLDRALRPVRNVKVVTTQRGVISKDEINEYTVTIELANPYPHAMPVRVIDQIPIVGDSGAKNVEIKLARSEPAPASHDDAHGTLEWGITLPPSGKSTVTFVYTIKRPKGFELRQ